MALSYEFSIGSVRAKECSLFSAADIEQMLALGSEEELFRFLSDKGYGDGDTVDELLEDNTRRMWSYLRSIAPDMEIFSPFMRSNDIHNFKTVLKGMMSGRDTDDMILEPGTISVGVMKEAVESRRFDRLPQWLSEAADQSYNLLAQTKDARLSDALIDRAYLSRLQTDAQETKTPFLAEYFRATTFYADIKLLIRAARTSASRDYLERAVCPVEGLDKPQAVKKALSGSDALLKYLSSIQAYSCYRAIEAYNSSPSEFERYVDNYLMQLTRKSCRYGIEGAQPMLGYYLACENERKIIHIIAGGIRTKTPPEKIRERLRETYG